MGVYEGECCESGAFAINIRIMRVSGQVKSETLSSKAVKVDITHYMRGLGVAARKASRQIGKASVEQKNTALRATADILTSSLESIRIENERDLDAGRQNGLSDALLDRLTLSQKAINTLVDGLAQVGSLPDPVGEVTDMAYQPSGIQVGRMRVPLGVIGMIYESRPNVTIEAGSLCLKSGNAVILRGGSEAFYSNHVLASCLQKGLVEAGLPAETIQLVSTTDRAAVGELVRMDSHVDVIVPRGGKGLIERISREATIPVIKHLDGICHVYIDEAADNEQAINIAFNAKTQRYAVCNAMETLLVAESRAADVLPELAERLIHHGVELRGCEKTCTLLEKALLAKKLEQATEADWQTEYLAPVLSIRIVADLDEAIDHINTWGSAHTDTIVTDNYQNAMRFIREVDSSSVLVNASTRFSDGFEYGLGAEIGISTDKLHARGPVGLEGLTSQKYIVLGNGQIRR